MPKTENVPQDAEQTWRKSLDPCGRRGADCVVLTHPRPSLPSPSSLPSPPPPCPPLTFPSPSLPSLTLPARHPQRLGFHTLPPLTKHLPVSGPLHMLPALPRNASP